MIPTLYVDQLNYHHKKQQLLHNINFHVNPGELVGVIGPNGAGKSTLLKCLSGFLPPSAGIIQLLTKNLHDYSHRQRAQKMSYLPQYTTPAFGFIVKDIIYFGAQCQDKKSILKNEEKNITNIINELEISHLLNRPLNQLSGGEQQRIHFARILIQNTAVILLDEPTASLDIGHESQLLNILSRHCQQGKSALIAIHDLNSAITFCDRLLLLDHGKQLAFDTPEKVLTPKQITTLYQDNVNITYHSHSKKLYLLPQRKQ